MPNSWVQDIVQDMTNLGGSSLYKDLYDEIYRIRGGDVPRTYENVIRRTIQTHSSDSNGFQGTDLFYSVDGLGRGRWGLREQIRRTPTAIDLSAPEAQYEEDQPRRRLTETYRILRDTALARTLKEIHDDRCQICGETLELRDGTRYSEAHHIKPLGRPHYGPDTEGNILVLCPNHHALCDLQAIELEIRGLRLHRDHKVEERFIDYHNGLL
jgi:hypothetical protein